MTLRLTSLEIDDWNECPLTCYPEFDGKNAKSANRVTLYQGRYSSTKSHLILWSNHTEGIGSDSIAYVFKHKQEVASVTTVPGFEYCDVSDQGVFLITSNSTNINELRSVCNVINTDGEVLYKNFFDALCSGACISDCGSFISFSTCNSDTVSAGTSLIEISTGEVIQKYTESSLNGISISIDSTKKVIRSWNNIYIGDTDTTNHFIGERWHIKLTQARTFTGKIVAEYFEPDIKGIKYYCNDTSSLSLGTKVVLKREPKNSHDSNAIKCFVNNEPIGYIDKIRAKIISKYLDSGAKPIAIVAGTKIKRGRAINPIKLLVTFGSKAKLLQKLP